MAPGPIFKLSFLLLLLLLRQRAIFSAEQTTTGIITVYNAFNASLTEVPSDIPSTVITINLEKNNITSIPDYAFSGLAVKEINLASSQIESISEVAFYDTELMILYLEDNRLTSLPNLTVVKPTLTQLRLSGNPLLGVDSSLTWTDYFVGFNLWKLVLVNLSMAVFPNVSNTAETLRTLNLSYNKIETIPPESFAHMDNLLELILQYNRLNSVPDFSSLRVGNGFKKLNLKGNNISSVEPDGLKNLPNLKELGLSYNRFTVFPNLSAVAATLETLYIQDNDIVLPVSAHASFLKQLQDMPKLKELYLSRNKLTKIPPITHSSLQTVSFNGNPLTCECPLSWSKSASTSANLNVRLSSEPCTQPVGLIGRSWTSISAQELCPGIKGYYVGTEDTNWALNKPTFQSSVNVSGNSEKAVDGFLSGEFFWEGCTKTDSEANPWWAVDLGTKVTVTEVTIVNRMDCCGSRLHDFDIGVTNASPSSQTPTPGNYDLCQHVAGIAASVSTAVCEVDIQGRYVVILIPRPSEILTLCEVEVYGFGEETDTTITMEDHWPELAFDGTKGTCALAKYSTVVYWMFAMARPAHIAGLKMFLSLDSIQSVELIVDAGSGVRCTSHVIEDFLEMATMDIEVSCDHAVSTNIVTMVFRGINEWQDKHFQVRLCEIQVVEV